MQHTPSRSTSRCRAAHDAPRGCRLWSSRLASSARRARRTRRSIRSLIIKRNPVDDDIGDASRRTCWWRWTRRCACSSTADGNYYDPYDYTTGKRVRHDARHRRRGHASTAARTRHCSSRSSGSPKFEASTIAVVGNNSATLVRRTSTRRAGWASAKAAIIQAVGENIEVRPIRLVGMRQGSTPVDLAIERRERAGRRHRRSHADRHGSARLLVADAGREGDVADELERRGAVACREDPGGFVDGQHRHRDAAEQDVHDERCDSARRQRRQPGSRTRRWRTWSRT